MNDTPPPTAATPSLPFEMFDQPAEQMDWAVLERFAEAAVTSPDEVIVPMMSRYGELDAAVNAAIDADETIQLPTGLVQIPAIFGLAGPDLTHPWQERVARWLVEQIETASADDDDLKHEIMSYAGERLGEGGLTVAAQHIRTLDPDAEDLWRTPRYALWSIAETCVRHAGPSEARRQLDEWSKQRIDQVVRERLSPDDLNGPMWYLIRSDPAYMAGHIDVLMAQAREAWPGQGARHNPALRELSAAAAYLRGDPEEVDLYDRPTDYRRAMQKQLDWLNAEPPAESDLSFFDEDGSWNDDTPVSQSMPLYDSPEPIVRDEPRVGRNDPCPCGSGKKYKKCCMNG